MRYCQRIQRKIWRYKFKDPLGVQARILDTIRREILKVVLEFLWLQEFCIDYQGVFKQISYGIHKSRKPDT